MRGFWFAIAMAIAVVGSWGRAAWAQTTGALVVVTDPAGAEVSIDGEAVGAAPVKRALLPGDHLVEAKFAQGKASQVVKVSAGQSAVVNLAAPAATPSSTPPPPPPSTPPPPPPPTTTTTTPPPPPAPTVTPPAEASAAPTAGVSRIEGDVLSGTHPHRRLDFGFGGGIGFRCSGTQGLASYGSEGYNGDASAGGCGFDLHLVPFDFPYGDVHVDLSFGGPGPFGFHPAAAIGSPWFGIGGRSSPFAMNVRFNLGYTIQTLSGRVDGGIVNDKPVDGVSGQWAGPELGVGVTGSIAITHAMTIDVNLIGGFDPLGTMHMQVTYIDQYGPHTGANFEPGTWHFTLTGGIRL